MKWAKCGKICLQTCWTRGCHKASVCTKDSICEAKGDKRGRACLRRCGHRCACVGACIHTLSWSI